MSPISLCDLLDFDIDRYLNPWVPHNRLYLLPKPISRWFGYRARQHKEPLAVLQWPITFIATVASLCLIAGIYNYAPAIARWNPPVIVASLGASAVLDFNTIRSPLAQPRNAFIGNTLAAICGVAIAKLFQLNPDFQQINWVAGAVGCALASLVMSITNTVHPPGGATAILASTDAQIVALGWRYVPLVIIGTVLMTTTALFFNNILRQYPVFWWTPNEVGQQLRRKQREQRGEGSENVEKAMSDSHSDRTLHHVDSTEFDEVRITPYKLQLPSGLQLTSEEFSLLEVIQNRLSGSESTE